MGDPYAGHIRLGGGCHCQSEGEIFLKNQSTAGTGQCLSILGKMDILDGVGQRAKGLSAHHVRRQHLRQMTAHPLQCVPNQPGQNLLGQAGTERIHGHDARQDHPRCACLPDGGGHLHRTAFHADAPKETELAAGMEHIPQIILIEVGDLHRSRFIKGAEFQNGHTPPYHPILGFSRHRQKQRNG